MRQPGAIRGHLRDPEVENLHERRSVLAPRQKEVLRLQVSVHDAALVRFAEGRRDLPEPLDDVGGRRGSVPGQVLEIVSFE